LAADVRFGVTSGNPGEFDRWSAQAPKRTLQGGGFDGRRLRGNPSVDVDAPAGCCPAETTGKTPNFVSIPARKNKSVSEIRNYDKTKTSRSDYGGRFANATRRGAGSDGRKGDAGDAYPARTAKPRGPDPPTLGSSLLRSSIDDGG
jgi:hypothetical protein